MGVKKDFMVVVTKKEVVAAVSPMHEHWLPMSNLDLLLPPVDGRVFICYKKTPEEDKLFTFGSKCGVLKKSLAQVLVSYYAFAGEIVQNGMGEPELLCNNRGVDFLEAFADLDLCDLDLYNLDESVESKLVPKKKQGVLCIQVTKFKCGGLMVGCAFDHRVADAYSADMFLVSWSETARSIPISLLPSFRRSLLQPRHPGSYSCSPSRLYIRMSALPPPPKPKHPLANHRITRIYYISADNLIRLQQLGSVGGAHKTKLEVFCAFLWKLAAATKGKGEICKLGLAVDGRMRLSGGDSDKSKLFRSYFGNVVSVLFGEKQIRALTSEPLSSTADSVHEFLQNDVTKDHFLDLIDWVETQRPEPLLARGYAGGEEGPNGPALAVSSGLRFMVSKVEFGWGKPVLGAYMVPCGGETSFVKPVSSFVMPMRSPVGNGDWIVYMHMTKGLMELIERELSDVFRPLSFDYLSGNQMNIRGRL